MSIFSNWLRRHNAEWLYRLVVIAVVLVFLKSAFSFVSPFLKPFFASLEVPEELRDPYRIPDPTTHWLDGDSQFVLTADTTPLYKEPNDLYPFSDTLPPLSRVMAYRNLAPNNSEDWVFLCATSGSPLGWVRSEDLVRKTDFVEPVAWSIGDFKFQQGAKHAVFRTHKKGYFKVFWSAKGDGLRLEGVQKGRFYGHKKVILAKVWYPDVDHYFFYLDDSKQLIQEVNFSDFMVQSIPNLPQ